MARVSRRRVIPATPSDVWELVADPYNLPRWWPRVGRVEAVDRKSGERRSQWTKVLETSEGKGVRADYRCLSAAKEERYVWEQQIEGSPFAKHLTQSGVEIGMRAVDGGTEVSITSSQTLRGLSRLGGVMMRGGQRRILDQALDGLESALGGAA